MKTEERYELIIKNLQEVLGEDELKEKLGSEKEVSVYWGTAPTGSVSIAYFFPMMKVADFLRAGMKVKILLADWHALLDSIPWEELEKRTAYYKKALVTILEIIGVSVDNLEFVLGSSIQRDKKYFEDLLKMSSFVSVHDSNKAASEVVKMSQNPKLSGLIYPLMQALDEEYLKVDCQLGGVDQRKIMVLAREYLPKIGYKSRVELMNPLIRGLIGEKMSSSQANTKIDLMDDEKTVEKRINKADCVEGDPNNGLMALSKYLIFGVNDKFLIERPEKFGGNLEYSNYEELEESFSKKELHPMDLKKAVARELNKLLKKFQEDKELKKLHMEAYGE